MKTIQQIASFASVLLGVFFLLNMGTDIQLGFGLVLVFTGVTSWK